MREPNLPRPCDNYVGRAHSLPIATEAATERQPTLTSVVAVFEAIDGSDPRVWIDNQAQVP